MTARAISAFGLEVSHSENIPRWQKKQAPQEIVKGTTTRSPRFSRFTAPPTSTTSPIGSWPRMSPGFMVGMKPP
jgi:hypothetical protein